MHPFDCGSAARALWSWLRDAVDDTNFIVVLGLCTIGLLATVIFIHYFPNFGEMAESLGQF